MAWKRALWIGGLAGAVAAIAGLAVLVNIARKRNSTPVAAGPVAVQVTTSPAGASVRVNGETKCTSDCEVALPEGTYQITAFLDGYESAARSLTVTAGKPASLSLALVPQAQSLRILTDLDQGKVAFDGQPPADLHDGQFFLDKLSEGLHTVKVAGRASEVSFAFEIVPAKMPALSGAVTAKNLTAVLVTNLGGSARVAIGAGPLKLAVNGQPEEDAVPAGVDVKNYRTGPNEFVLGDGKDRRSLKESFGPAPGLTVFLTAGPINTGTLIVSTGVSDARVFLNGREYPRRTQRGELRIPIAGKVSVRVAKEGFEAPPEKTVEVQRGAEVRVDLNLVESVFLLVRGGTPGAEVVVDGKSLGILGSDGSLNSQVAAGDHVVELKLAKFVTKRLERSFKGAQPVTLSGADVTLAPERVVVAEVKKPEPPPPPPPPVKERIPPPPPVAKTGTIADFEDPGAWRKDKEEDVWLHKGAAFLAYKLPANGVFTFTIRSVKGGSLFRGVRVRWCLDYVDSKNYTLFELDDKNFWAKEVVKGKTTERAKTQHNLDKQKSLTIQLEVSPERVTNKLLNGDKSINLDTWAPGGRNFSEGKFGFLINGNDEIGISDFKFVPK